MIYFKNQKIKSKLNLFELSDSNFDFNLGERWLQPSFLIQGPVDWSGSPFKPAYVGGEKNTYKCKCRIRKQNNGNLPSWMRILKRKREYIGDYLYILLWLKTALYSLSGHRNRLRSIPSVLPEGRRVRIPFLHFIVHTNNKKSISLLIKKMCPLLYSWNYLAITATCFSHSFEDEGQARNKKYI